LVRRTVRHPAAAVQKVSSTGTNGNGDVWARHQATFNRGANT
jgi:hypothetical protein